MGEKLIIKNFGPIKDAELKLSRFNLLIGENATGKSTIAKVLAVCRYFSYIMWDGTFEIPNPDESHFSLGLTAWGLGDYIQSDSFIYYECQHYSLTVENEIRELPGFDPENDKVTEVLTPVFSQSLEPLSAEFKHLLFELESLKPKPKDPYDYDPFWTPPISFYQNNVAKIMDNPFYLPTERGLQSIFSLGKSSIQNISDSLFNQFARIDQVARLFKNETSIEPLEITYKNDNGKGYVRKDKENNFLSLFNAASGYQSTIPVILVIKYYTELRKKGKTFIIEEPELNLFPVAQQRLMQYLVDKTMNYGNNIFLTTHSPYILTSLNNLIYAGQVKKSDQERTKKIIEEKYWLNPDDVSGYMMLPNGLCEDIIDREENMIKAEKIDDISRKLNSEFDSLQDIELGIKG